MVNPEIFEGLKQAVLRGEALRSAMISFYNAGYPKEDIEAAARLVQEERKNQSLPQSSEIQEAQKKLKALGQQIKQTGEQTQQPTIQKVSEYEEKKTKLKFNKKIVIIIVLTILLIFLIGMLSSMFLYKDKVVELLTKLFG